MGSIDIYQYFSRTECLKGRDAQYPLDEQLENNLATLLIRLNKFREIYGKPMYINSLYRPGQYNVAAGGAPNSAHLTCEACDFADRDGALKNFVLANPDVLVECDLYMEDPSRTLSWQHLQSRVIPSGHRIFNV